MTEDIQNKMDAELEAAENEGMGPVAEADEAVAAEDPQPKLTPISREAFLGFPPSLQFIVNFRDIYAAFADASGSGKSIKAPAAKEIVALAANYASLFTQIELQQGVSPK